jgi:uncharacterized protein
VIAVDTNLLVYAHREDSPQHAAAKAALTGLRQGRSLWAVPWPCVHEFYAVVTHPRIHKTPTPPKIAMAAIRSWAATGNQVFVGEGEGYLDRLLDLCGKAHVSGPKIHDARIAAICLHHAVSELWSADRDFASFPGLKTRNPIFG